MQNAKDVTINGICPYYTMYPLEFPLRVLKAHARKDQWVFDPFCGRGTTNLAARMLGLPSVGIDSNPVAVALAKAKLHHVELVDVVRAAVEILRFEKEAIDIPSGRFWTLAYHEDTLRDICKLRQGLLRDCRSNDRVVLRAILLGALHGPVRKNCSSYLSNQCPRTFAPKPDYAVKFWTERKLFPPKSSVIEAVVRRAVRFLLRQPQEGVGRIIHIGLVFTTHFEDKFLVTFVRRVLIL